MLKSIIALKLCLVSFCVFLCSNNINAQASITVEASQAFSKFRFISSEGTKDKSYSYKLSNAYHLGYMYSLENGIFFQGNFGMRKGGATYVFEESNFEWDLNYIDFRIGGGYAYSFGDLDAFISLSPYYSHLLTANQILDNEAYDMVKQKDIKRADLGLYISPGAQYKISNSMSIYGQFDTMIGLRNLETSNNSQITNNRAIAFTFGLVFSLNSITNSSL